jgi:hypothetical protein
MIRSHDPMRKNPMYYQEPTGIKEDVQNTRYV